MQSKSEDKQKRRGKKSSETTQSCGDNDIVTRFQLLSIDPNTANKEILPGDNLPQHVLYYGWFFSNEASLLIKEVADAYFIECLDNVRQFQRFIKRACEAGTRDPEQYYKKPGKWKSLDELKYHITSKFLDRKPNLHYTTMVQPFVGKTFRIHIVGLYFTQKSFGIRVKLTDAQKIMFDEREEIPGRVCSPSSLNHSESNSTSTDASVKPYQKTIDDELASYKPTLKAKNPKCKSLLHSRFASKGIALRPRKPNDFQPTSSRAHITIGCGPNGKAVQTGIDLLDIVDLERRADSTSVAYQDYPIDGGTLRQLGDAFVIYPCHEIVVEATFNFCKG